MKIYDCDLEKKKKNFFPPRLERQDTSAGYPTRFILVFMMAITPASRMPVLSHILDIDFSTKLFDLLHTYALCCIGNGVLLEFRKCFIYWRFGFVL